MHEREGTRIRRCLAVCLFASATLLVGFVRTPEASAALKPVGSRLSLAAYGSRTPLRTNGAAVYFGQVDAMNEMDSTDTHFIKARGLSDPGCVSFESAKWPGHYLRHRGAEQRVELSDAWWDPWFSGDATFCPRPAPGTPSWADVQQFEAANARGYFLRIVADQLIVSSVNSQTYFVEMAPVSLGVSTQWTGWIVHSDGNAELQVWAACTGLTPPWSPRRTTLITAALSTGRIVVSAAVSTSYIGFYPRITLTGRGDDLGSVYTIRQEVLPCVW